MTPKEKAIELFDKYAFIEIANYSSKHEVKECALIAVDEVIESLYNYDKNVENDLKESFPNYFSCQVQNMERDMSYWDKVKQEIENL